MAHTPGPWLAFWDGTVGPAAHATRRLGAADNDAYRDEFVQRIARVEIDRYGRGDREANARLIAAAPDLLAALLALVSPDFDEHPQDFHPDWHAARAAIAKATGESA